MHVKYTLSLVSLAPRLVQLGSLAAVGLSLQGCVSARHYEEARSVAESETAAHGRTRDRLEAAAKRIHALEADLALKERAMADSESVAAQSKLDTTVAQKEREAADELVDQLRSELARTGDHLSSYFREKRDLQQTLLVAEQRMLGVELAGKNLSELVATTRDLALALEAEIDKGRVDLGAKDGQIVVGVNSEKLFAPNGDALVADAVPVLSAVGKATTLHPTLRVIVREPAGAPLAASRLKHLGDALRERGIADARLSLVSARVEEPTGGAALPASDASSEPDAAAEKPEETPAGKAVSKKPFAAPVADPGSLRYEIAFAI